jgi:hypothetical protein
LFTILELQDSGGVAGSQSSKAGGVLRGLRFARMTRLLRLAKLKHLLPALVALIETEWMTIVFVVGKNLVSILVLNHYIGCLWFGLGASGHAGPGWVKKYGYSDDAYGDQYLVSLEWSLSQFTPGKSHVEATTTSERAFVATVLILAMVVATCFVSSITSALGQIWSMHRYSATQSFLLKKFLRQTGISRSLASRVTHYIDGVLELRQSQVHPSKVDYLNLLSGPLNIELHQGMHLPHLSLFPLFYHCSKINAFITGQLCTTAVTELCFGKNDVLFKQGTVAEHMCFLTAGTLAYRYTKKGKDQPTTCKLETDQWCSEAVLWVPWIHCGQMKAVSQADISTVNAAKFIDLVRSNEDVYKFARGCAFRFWNSIDPVKLTDLPHTMSVNSSQAQAVDPSREGGSGAAVQVRQAEDAEVSLIQFDP